MSQSTVALVGACLLLAGGGFNLLARLPLNVWRIAGERRLVVSRPRIRPSSDILGAASLVWLALAAVFLVAPLRYAGALSHNSFDVRAGEFLTHGRFDPLSEIRPPEVGQCLVRREVQDANEVVPCSVAHKAQIVSEGLGANDCPPLEDFDLAGLDLEIAASELIGGTSYCVVQLRDSARGWDEPVVSTASLAVSP